MDKNKICEALYALPDGVVVRRRKSVLMPAAVLIVGVALIAVSHYFHSALSEDMRSALVFVGGIVAVVGVVMMLVRLFGSSGAPYYRPSKSFLHCEEHYFDHKMWHDIAQCIQDGEITRLREMEHSRVPAVAVVLYSTSDDSFAAAQAFEYADLEYRPLTEVRIFGK